MLYIPREHMELILNRSDSKDDVFDKLDKYFKIDKITYMSPMIESLFIFACIYDNMNVIHWIQYHSHPSDFRKPTFSKSKRSLFRKLYSHISDPFALDIIISAIFTKRPYYFSCWRYEYELAENIDLIIRNTYQSLTDFINRWAITREILINKYPPTLTTEKYKFKSYQLDNIRFDFQWFMNHIINDTNKTNHLNTQIIEYLYRTEIIPNDDWYYGDGNYRDLIKLDLDKIKTGNPKDIAPDIVQQIKGVQEKERIREKNHRINLGIQVLINASITLDFDIFKSIYELIIQKYDIQDITRSQFQYNNYGSTSIYRLYLHKCNPSVFDQPNSLSKFDLTTFTNQYDKENIYESINYIIGLYPKFINEKLSSKDKDSINSIRILIFTRSCRNGFLNILKSMIDIYHVNPYQNNLHGFKIALEHKQYHIVKWLIEFSDNTIPTNLYEYDKGYQEYLTK
jgi:hypothetical protein